MEKNLPKVFVNPIKNKLNNVQDVFNSSKNKYNLVRLNKGIKKKKDEKVPKL